jgi:predicted DsbA family dithiol-disulfide isomerase
MMKVRVIYYLDIISSWCFTAEAAWSTLKHHYREIGAPVTFEWRVALMDESGMPSSKEQMAWFYRRSGIITRRQIPFVTDWFEPELKEYLAPHCVAEATRDLGSNDDMVRLALAKAALYEGQKIGRWDVAVSVAADASGLKEKMLVDVLLEKARSAEIEQKIRATTAEFHALGGKQRPTFVILSDFGDRAVISGLVKVEPLKETIDAMLEDSEAMASFATHFGAPPEK